MPIEVIEHAGVRYAEVLRASAQPQKSGFFSKESNSLQLGMLAYSAGQVIAPHTHEVRDRHIGDVQEFVFVKRGKLTIELFTEAGRKVADVTLAAGDSILLISGAHSIRAHEDTQCIAVKQGPFYGDDKIAVKTS